MSGETVDVNNNPLGYCSSIIVDSLKDTLSKLGIEATEITLEKPPEGKGDFAFPCFALAKSAKKAPRDIAKEIAENIELIDILEKCESAGPYVNFHIKSEELARMTLDAVFSMGDDYGNLPSVGTKIILEHTSANPTDKLHIGRARNPIIGDTLARILRKAGYDVETQYYVDDMGKQAVTLAYGVHIWDGRPENDDSLGPYQYASKMVGEDQGMEAERDEWLQKLESGDPEVRDKVREACARVMDEDISDSLLRINVTVDKYLYESQFVEDGSVDSVIERLKSSQYADMEDGAEFIDMEPFTDRQEKFFFIRADGTSLYATRDIAYHLYKYEHCDEVINILGEDHKRESEQVKIGLQIMGQEKYPEVIFYSFVSLPEGRMSTRKGKVVFLDDLLSEAHHRALEEVRTRRDDVDETRISEIARSVALGAVRYNIVRVQPEKKMVFKWEDALNFEGASAPFIQYSHARACSILRKSGEEEYESYNSEVLSHPSERAFIMEMAGFPEAIFQCAHKRSPHLIASYAYSLASVFNQFYRDCPVLACEDEQLKMSRLALVSAGKKVLRNALFCLGIDAPEEM